MCCTHDAKASLVLCCRPRAQRVYVDSYVLCAAAAGRAAHAHAGRHGHGPKQVRSGQVAAAAAATSVLACSPKPGSLALTTSAITCNWCGFVLQAAAI
jgi:hypothetical protein